MKRFLWILLLLARPAQAQDGQTATIVQEMIRAHGGMEAWKSAPTVKFTDRWGEEAPASTIVVEQGRRRSTLEVQGTDTRLAWDGEKVWSVNWERGTPPRFVAQLNYYFLNLPWLTQDPGVRLKYEGEHPVRGSEKAYHHVRMTFEPGTGDTPDDYYVLWIDPDSKRLHGCEYIVTYKPLLPEGTDATTPHDLIFEEFAEVDGLVVPTRFTIYEGDAVYASCTIGDWSFDQPFDESALVMPEGAVIDRSLEADDAGGEGR